MSVIVARSIGSRLRGLFGRRGFQGVLLLAPCNDIHTFGMRQCIDVAFVSECGTVVESHAGVRPWRRLKCRGASITVERFSRDSPWLQPGDRMNMEELAVFGDERREE